MSLFQEEATTFSGDDGLTEYKLWVHYNHMAVQISCNESYNVIWFHQSLFSDKIKMISHIINLANEFQFSPILLVDILKQIENHLDHSKIKPVED